MAESNETTDLVNLPDDVKVVISEGKNGKLLKCQRCPSIILKEMTAKYVNKNVSMDTYFLLYKSLKLLCFFLNFCNAFVLNQYDYMLFIILVNNGLFFFWFCCILDFPSSYEKED